MHIRENEAGGESVILVAGDELAAIPESHVHLLTPALREAFFDPVRYFCRIAERCPFPEMRRWLNALLETPRWQLQLHEGYAPDWTAAGYSWSSETVRGAMIGLPRAKVGGLPQALQDYYALVDEVDWMGFGCAGGLSRAGEHEALNQTYQLEFYGADIDPADAFVWGVSPCGDILIWSRDNRGAWVSHETGHIQLLGTIEDSIDCVFRSLNANECPEYDYRRA